MTLELEWIEDDGTEGRDTEIEAREAILRDLRDSGVNHWARVVEDAWWCGHHFRVVGTVVEFSNDDDGYYVQRFHSAERMDAFVEKLVKVRNQVWPPVASEGAHHAQ